ncbi:DUF4890 domain-containing protein [Neptunitalea chrysea]|uniref:DUF4890 domain-containing protein n=1 Tax=Neptunitalea chrysea TaxID=1647581 RepID=A0A9W6B3Y7_9FLAO|nr:DUF4890 domain-containing protein [Neptunitalea chrysea]GLB52000.1 DUF4890 domain-containing protein [Neptunitalea chrysea]
MKKLLVLATILVTTVAMAQGNFQEKVKGRDGKDPRPGFERMMEDFTPEQIATLKTKRLTLALDLTEKQQKELLKVNTKMATKRKAKFEAMKTKREKAKDGEFERPTAEERFAMENERLDEQIAFKNKMKSILTDEQYQKWYTMREQRKEGMKKHMKSNFKDGKRHRLEGSIGQKSRQ